jgi:hypothetical protein
VNSAVAPRRNDPCPCGSGKRYKNCHGSLSWDPRLEKVLERQAAGDLPGALVVLDGILAETPNHPRALNIQGVVRHELMDLPGAEESLRKAIALSPDFADAHMNLGLVLLILGRYAEAWPEYEWRTRRAGYKDYANFDFGMPRWKGEPLTGKAILVHGEQGLGDTIQCARFLAPLAKEASAVDVFCHPPLVDLMQRMRGVRRAYATLAERPTQDFHAPIIDIAAHYLPHFEAPHWLGPYITPLPERVARWSPEIAGARRPLVGFTWKGSALQANDSRRSLAPQVAADFTRRAANATFVNLQFGEPPPAGADWIDVGSKLRDWDDTVAVISQLDLVIAVDTAVVHIAGAMGKPVWVVRPFYPDWRWGASGESARWYPSATILNQYQPGDWSGVLDDVVRRLEAL